MHNVVSFSIKTGVEIHDSSEHDPVIVFKLYLGRRRQCVAFAAIVT